MASVPSQPVRRGSAEWAEVLRWAGSRFDRALLLLGDTSERLAQHAQLWAWTDGAAVRGAALRFCGFERPIVTAVADAAEIFESVVLAARPNAGATLAVHEAQPLPAALEAAPFLYDPWLDAPCTPRELPDVSGLCALTDMAELAAFYAREQVRYWCPAMFGHGHYHGVRDASGSLVAAGGVNFLLPDHGYAQLGGLATTSTARRRSYATAILRAIESSLARAGIARCGLFADAGDPTLAAFYAARGFALRGGFRFIQL